MYKKNCHYIFVFLFGLSTVIYSKSIKTKGFPTILDQLVSRVIYNISIKKVRQVLFSISKPSSCSLGQDLED